MYKIPTMLYIEAFDKKMAKALAEISVFVATNAIQEENSSFCEDETSIMTVSGKPKRITNIPTKSYDKKVLIETIGEDKAIRWLNDTIK